MTYDLGSTLRVTAYRLALQSCSMGQSRTSSLVVPMLEVRILFEHSLALHLTSPCSKRRHDCLDFRYRVCLISDSTMLTSADFDYTVAPPQRPRKRDTRPRRSPVTPARRSRTRSCTLIQARLHRCQPGSTPLSPCTTPTHSSHRGRARSCPPASS